MRSTPIEGLTRKEAKAEVGTLHIAPRAPSKFAQPPE
jgi:hypothetical protein